MTCTPCTVFEHSALARNIPIAATRLEGNQAEAFSFSAKRKGRAKRAVPQLQSGAPAGRHEASLGDVGNSPSFLLTRNWRSILQSAVWLVHSSQLRPPVSSLPAGFFFDACKNQMASEANVTGDCLRALRVMPAEATQRPSR